MDMSDLRGQGIADRVTGTYGPRLSTDQIIDKAKSTFWTWRQMREMVQVLRAHVDPRDDDIGMDDVLRETLDRMSEAIAMGEEEEAARQSAERYAHEADIMRDWK